MEEKKITDVVLDKIVEEAKQDVVLEIRQRPNGTLSWRVPPDLVQASYLLQILQIAVSKCVEMSIKPTQSKIIRPS